MDFEKGHWYTRDNARIANKDMDTNHLNNAINFLGQHPEFYAEGAYDPYGNNGYFDPNYELQEEKLKELKEELGKREVSWN